MGGGIVTLLANESTETTVLASDFQLVSGNFEGNVAFTTTNNNGNKIQCGSKGYKYLSKLNDIDVELIPYKQVAEAFNITKDDEDNVIVPSEWNWRSDFCYRLTNNGLDGGSAQFTTVCELLKDEETFEARLIIYDSLTDTMRVEAMESFSIKTGQFTTKSQLSYTDVFGFIFQGTYEE